MRFSTSPKFARLLPHLSTCSIVVVVFFQLLLPVCTYIWFSYVFALLIRFYRPLRRPSMCHLLVESGLTNGKRA